MNFPVAEYEVDDVVLGVFGDDGGPFDSSRKFAAADGDAALEVRRDDAAVVGEFPFDQAGADVDVAELNG